MPPRLPTPWPRSGAHRMFHRVFRAVHTVETPGRIIPPIPIQEPPETTVSGACQLRQTEREDAVASPQPLLKEGPYTVAIALCPTVQLCRHLIGAIY